MSEESEEGNEAPSASSSRSFFLIRPAAFTVLVSLFAACLFPYSAGGSDLTTMVYLGTALSLSCLFGTWLGILNRWWRFFAAPFVIVAVGCSAGFFVTNSFDYVAGSISCLSFLIAFGTLEVAKLFFGKFRLHGESDQIDEGLQFRISHLMIVTAVVAVFISLLKMLMASFPTSDQLVSADLIVIASAFIGTLVLITLSATWALMGRNVAAKLVAFVAVSFSAISFSCWFAPSTEIAALWLGMFLICWFTVTMLLWLLRLEGLRFVRRS